MHRKGRQHGLHTRDFKDMMQTLTQVKEQSRNWVGITFDYGLKDRVPKIKGVI